MSKDLRKGRKREREASQNTAAKRPRVGDDPAIKQDEETKSD
jgi:hypothetical protein